MELIQTKYWNYTTRFSPFHPSPILDEKIKPASLFCNFAGIFEPDFCPSHTALPHLAARLVYRFDTGDTEKVSLFGGGASGIFNVVQKDRHFYQVVYGPGVARFRGGMSAALDGAGELQALTDLGYTLGYERHWTSSRYSVFVYNHGEIDNTEGQAPNAAAIRSYTAADLIWNFTEKAFVGIEYLWGMREDLDGSDGTANRLQLSLRYSFP